MKPRKHKKRKIVYHYHYYYNDSTVGGEGGKGGAGGAGGSSVFNFATSDLSKQESKTGAQGPQGPEGPQGPQGPTGDSKKLPDWVEPTLGALGTADAAAVALLGYHFIRNKFNSTAKGSAHGNKNVIEEYNSNEQQNQKFQTPAKPPRSDIKEEPEMTDEEKQNVLDNIARRQSEYGSDDGIVTIMKRKLAGIKLTKDENDLLNNEIKNNELKIKDNESLVSAIKRRLGIIRDQKKQQEINEQNVKIEKESFGTTANKTLQEAINFKTEQEQKLQPENISSRFQTVLSPIKKKREEEIIDEKQNFEDEQKQQIATGKKSAKKPNEIIKSSAKKHDLAEKMLDIMAVGNLKDLSVKNNLNNNFEVHAAQEAKDIHNEMNTKKNRSLFSNKEAEALQGFYHPSTGMKKYFLTEQMQKAEAVLLNPTTNVDHFETFKTRGLPFRLFPDPELVKKSEVNSAEFPVLKVANPKYNPNIAKYVTNQPFRYLTQNNNQVWKYQQTSEGNEGWMKDRSISSIWDEVTGTLPGATETPSNEVSTESLFNDMPPLESNEVSGGI